jgi:hypothetical protein
MSQEMDQFIAEVYGTGVDPMQKIAAETQQAQVAQLYEMEKAAAVEAFTDKIASLGLNLDDYSNEDIAYAFDAFVKNAAAETAAQPEAEKTAAAQPSEDDLIKQAWLQADAYGRQLAQQEFLGAVKEAASQSTREILKEAPKELARQTEDIVGKGLASKPGQKIEQAVIKGLEKHPKKLMGAGAAGTAVGLGAAGYGGYKGLKHLKAKKEEEKKGSLSQTPFLDDAIKKMAMAIGISSGCITPDGECNLNKEGNLIYEPSWTEEVELDMPKTAMDQELYGLALQHLENLGYPVQWEG